MLFSYSSVVNLRLVQLFDVFLGVGLEVVVCAACLLTTTSMLSPVAAGCVHVDDWSTAILSSSSNVIVASIVAGKTV